MTGSRQILKIIFLPFAGIILMCLAVLSVANANAQSVPIGAKPIQRTIEAEGEESFSGPIHVGSDKTPNLAFKAPLYGLISIMLVLVATGAIYYFWVQSSAKTLDKTSAKTLDSPRSG